MRWLPLLLTALGLAATPAAACRLALVLALDVSSSVDPSEDRLQRSGLASALLSPEVTAALLAVPESPVALSVFEWSGPRQQVQILDWTLLHGTAEITRAARIIGGSRRLYSDFPTALGYALAHAALLLEIAPRCDQQTVDVSGDGRNNAGIDPAEVFRGTGLAGATVNGLAIGGAGLSGSLGGGDDGVATYYRDHVIRGPGAFVITASGYDDFERAMRRKLVREAGPPRVGALAE